MDSLVEKLRKRIFDSMAESIVYASSCDVSGNAILRSLAEPMAAIVGSMNEIVKIQTYSTPNHKGTDRKSHAIEEIDLILNLECAVVK
jgi:uncharacterized protein (UPF0371 family)